MIGDILSPFLLSLFLSLSLFSFPVFDLLDRRSNTVETNLDYRYRGQSEDFREKELYNLSSFSLYELSSFATIWEICLGYL